MISRFGWIEGAALAAGLWFLVRRKPVQLPATRELSSERKRDLYRLLVGPANAVARRLPVHPALILSQAAVESGWLRSMGEPGSVHLFGVRWGRWTPADAAARAAAIRRVGLPAKPAHPVSFPTTEEWTPGVISRVRGDFRAYPTVADAVYDHGYLLGATPIYQEARRYYRDPYRQAMAVWLSGYATASNYYDVLRGLIAQFTDEPEDPALRRLAERASRMDPGERRRLLPELRK